MGEIKKYLPVKLIMGVTTGDTALWEDVRPVLVGKYSAIDHELDWYDFEHTDYYRSEMGGALKKRFVSFQKPVPAETLPDIKLATNALENRHAIDGKRCINLDPGYICTPKLVLATTKDFAHRIYLGKGVFGDIHLKFLAGRFQPQEWTYPDYREPFVLAFFEEVRGIYMESLKNVPITTLPSRS